VSDDPPAEEKPAEVAGAEPPKAEPPTGEAKAEDADPPIADPLVGAQAAEADVILLEGFAARAGMLGKLSLVAGGFAVLIAGVAFTGRVDMGVLLYVLPVGAANVALGVYLGRASASFTDAAKARWSNRGSLVSGVRDLHKALGVQLLVTGFLVFLMLVALLIAAAFQRSTEI